MLLLRCAPLVGISLLLLPQGLDARPWYQQQIPNGDRVSFQGQLWPGVGHNVREGGGVRNPFGLDFQSAGLTWTLDLCQKDSDGDGRSNGNELGDPACIWKAGDMPSRSDNITHPGFKDGPGWDGGDDGDADCKQLDSEPGLITQNLTVPGFTIPSEKTTYQCVSGSFPTDQGYHAVRFRPINTSPGLVHHMVLYTCTSAPRSGTYPCWGMEKGCSSAMFAWAVGGGDFCTPNITGFRVGSGGAVHLVLQIHYDNPTNIPGKVDNSGVSIQYTTRIRQYDSALVRVGVPIKEISIPPRTAAHSEFGLCPSSITSQLDGPRTAYASLLHMHYLGQSIFTEGYRGGVKFAEFGRNDAWDFDLQRVEKFPSYRTLLPGDELRTTCVYNSSTTDTVTKGGEDTTTEMCFNFIAMYPPPGSPICEQKNSAPAERKWPMIVGIGAGVLVAVGTGVGAAVYFKRRAMKPPSEHLLS